MSNKNATENRVVDQQVGVSRRKFMSGLAVAAAATPLVSIAGDLDLDLGEAIALKPNEKGPYDVVILNGRVIDPETKLDAVRNLGIIKGRIAAISEKTLQGAKVIDASNLIVAPGFIDLHAHGQQLPAAWMQAFDGVTTALELESGVLPIDMAYRDVAEEGRPINYGFGASWAFARALVLEKDIPPATGKMSWFQQAFSYTNWQNSIPTDQELERILALVEEGISQGGIGISINAGYAPGMGRKEYYQLSKMAKKYNMPTFTHDRYMSVLEPQSSFEALGEQIGLAAITGAHMHVCHINSVSNRDLKAGTDLLKEAQAKGIPVTVESYSYGAFSTAIGAEFMRGDDWLQRFGNTDYGTVELLGKPMTKQSIIDLQETAPGSPINFHFLSEDKSAEDQALLDLAVLYPGGAIASDGMPWLDGKGTILEGDIWPLPADAFAHPRSSGCFSRFVHKWIVERESISLLDGLAKTSLIPANIISEAVPQMKKKGRIQVGCDADIICFDYNKIKDMGTFTEPAQQAAGHQFVMVNGQLVIDNNQRVEGKLPGQAIRRNV
ncbi:amidohydrolase family protein [Vibrio sp. 10N.261.46.E12]|uniref:amidohydrolase family protein n=1 Tax=unclassified Vibrio TaxID=2614977 RepID=UPI0009767F92|nr:MULTISPECIES: amidohydrolase family protein [unclassified Vibrio]OMO32062.1 D-glutamate deacylase [Vibrio sp. 10N.261.45.E1]PMJ22576.1 D-glutamate deacylase [Vibrio sp. 10N.286.45.B6]PML89440.1 D-glutamate deacylase [Vibrio sp. 10N.261.49.E11]PMM63979.1 D-glutamate deacylase [Vibrio sp. 10N.261.46.F12]PMM86781.1 D-glutamate deacylase [Vibrio sp. 10N.261.46.E8]